MIHKNSCPNRFGYVHVRRDCGCGCGQQIKRVVRTRLLRESKNECGVVFLNAIQGSPA